LILPARGVSPSGAENRWKLITSDQGDRLDRLDRLDRHATGRRGEPLGRADGMVNPRRISEADDRSVKRSPGNIVQARGKSDIEPIFVGIQPSEGVKLDRLARSAIT
jgi:hypothetical protein